nr:LOW QUALITY PROTEIN: golgin subfamily A member 8K-like [Macaca nemestrina]
MFLSFSFSTCLAFLPKVQIQTLNVQKGKLSTDLYRTKRSLRYFEEQTKDLAGRLQHSLQRKGELQRALSAVTATQKKADRSSSRNKARMEWKLEQSLREQALLKAQLTQMKDSLKQAHLERDEYVQHLKGERARWQQRMRKMSQEVCTLKKEKQHHMRLVEKLERSGAEEPRGSESAAAARPLPGHLQQSVATYQQQVAAYQQLTSEKEALHRQLLQQTQLMNQLQLQEAWGKAEHLEAASQQKQQLQDQLSLMALPGEGDGGHLDSEEEEGPRPMPSVPEDQESWEAMVAFFKSAGASAKEEQARLRERVTEQRVCCQHLAYLSGAAGDHLWVGSDYNNKHSKLLISAQNPAHEPRPGAPAPQELGAAHKHGDLCEVSLSVSAETGQGEAREGSPHDNPTAQPITQEHQEHQEHPGLGSNRCVPFFCWAWLPRRRR